MPPVLPDIRHTPADILLTLARASAMHVHMETQWSCACCGKINSSAIDPSAGRRQQFVEDCHICCRPNVITAVYNDYLNRYECSTYQEDRGE